MRGSFGLGASFSSALFVEALFWGCFLMACVSVAVRIELLVLSGLMCMVIGGRVLPPVRGPDHSEGPLKIRVCVRKVCPGGGV